MSEASAHLHWQISLFTEAIQDAALEVDPLARQAKCLDASQAAGEIAQYHELADDMDAAAAWQMEAQRWTTLGRWKRQHPPGAHQHIWKQSDDLTTATCTTCGTVIYQVR